MVAFRGKLCSILLKFTKSQALFELDDDVNNCLDDIPSIELFEV